MKKLVLKSNRLLALILGISLSSTAIAAIGNDSDEVTASKIEQFEVAEISDVSVFVEDQAQKVIVVDDQNEIIYSSKANNDEERYQIHMRTSDFLFEVDGTKYYKSFNN